MSLTLFKREIKASFLLWLIIMAVIGMYFAIIVWMYDPELGSALKTFEEAMSEMMAMFGMNPAAGDLTHFMGAYLYGMIMQLFPMLFTIILANRLIARHIDRGSMAYLLAAPVSRRKVAVTQLLVLVSGLLLMLAVTTGMGIALAELMFPGELDVMGFLRLNLGCFSLQLCIMGICFLSSCIFNESKWSLAFGAGIPLLAYVMQMLSTQGEQAEKLKYASFFTAFDTSGLISAEPEAWLQSAGLLLAGLILSIIGIIIFGRKDLPI